MQQQKKIRSNLEIINMLLTILTIIPMFFITPLYSEKFELVLVILYVSLTYMGIVSLLIFQVEPSTFDNNYLNAFYWSGITLTTVGYGDIYPVTGFGQFIALISSYLGIGIIALPTGVIGGEFMIKLSKN